MAEYEYINPNSDSQYFYESPYTFSSGSHRQLNYRSIKHLYFSNFNTGSGLVETTGSYENYIESSFFSGSRTMLETGRGIVYSVPKSLFGVNLEPSSVSISSSYGEFILTDDGDGNLKDGNKKVGIVIYTHGQLIVTSEDYYLDLSASEAASDPPAIEFKSNVPVYTNTYSIKVSDYEFNHTLNPTAQSGSSLNYIDEYGYEVISTHPSASKFTKPSGIYRNEVTGSDFQPYITTVGLYNDSNELIAVGKLAQPLPKPADTELTIQVKLDV